jgi:tetratricopeptide (TPR) repeat protein
VHELAVALAQAGEAEEALALARTIPDHVENYTGKDREYRYSALQSAAARLAEGGHGKQALKLVAAIADEEMQKQGRRLVGTKLALAHAVAGKFRDALEAVDALPEADAQVQALAGTLYANFTFTFREVPTERGIAGAQAEAGNVRDARASLQRAEKLARSIKDEELRAGCLANVTFAWASLGEVGRAREAARDIGTQPWKELAQAALARAQAEAGQEKAAAATVETIGDAAGKVHARHHLAVALARRGDRKASAAAFRRALDLVKDLPDTMHDLHCHNLASAQARAGDFEGAVQTTRLMNHGNAMMTISNIAYEQARASDVKGALEKVKDMLQESDFWQGNALQGIARVQAERGQETEALAWARELASPRTRAHAVLGVAEGLLRRAEKAKK